MTEPDTPPQCPTCAADMRLRTARKGRNAGSQFWGCSKYPKCRGTVPAATPTGPVHSNAATPTAASTVDVLRRKRVDWHDATNDRGGWATRQVSAGGSLRAVPHPQAGLLSTCWLARQTHPAHVAAVDMSVTSACSTMQRLLARGVSPPMHPDAETQLLETAGPTTPDPAGDRVVVPNRGPTVFADNMCDSAAEQQLVDVIEQYQPGAARWLIPQAPLDALAAAAETETSVEGQRRCDFLYCPPGAEPVVFEVDGSQHRTAKPADRERDRLAWKAGLDTIRISTDELRTGHGKGLAAVRKAVDDAHRHEVLGWEQMLWAPVQTHRLVLAVCEAVDAGFVSGDCWVIEVEDPTGAAPPLMGPYLGLLAAAFTIWEAPPGPATVVFLGQRSEIVYQRNPDGFGYSRIDTPPEASRHGPVSVRVMLQANWSPSEALPGLGDATPQIVVRSTGIPALPVDTVRPRTATRPDMSNDDDMKQAALEAVMHAVFAKPSFRDGQFEAVSLTLAGSDSVVLLPTGAGKSMIYQLAGLILPGRTLVVSPLVSLIDDQVRGLALHGIDRACGISAANSGHTLGVAEDGWFLYVTPERFQRQPFRDLLAAAAVSTPVNAVAVDEAHCVSEWGHDFRAAYLNFGRTVRRACAPTGGAVPPIVALTGTASHAVLNDVLFQLGIDRDDPDRVISPGSFDRPEIEYDVTRTTPPMSQRILQDTLRYLQAGFGGASPGIVFIPTVRGYHGLTDTLNAVRAVEPSAVGFSSKPPKGHNYNDWEQLKNQNAERFKTDDAAVIVSTKAFGMGIDKPNIRWIVHYGLPQSIESFYQEIGRAGRDRQPAAAVLVISETDRAANEKLLNPTRSAPSRRSSARDDVSTVLWFHNASTTTPEQDAQNVVDMYDTLQTGTHIPLGDPGTDRDNTKRALHRLAVLGVVDDYCLAGRGRSETAHVVLTGATPADVTAAFLGFVTRSQPGRVGELEARLTEFADTRAAVRGCARLLAEIVDETIGAARRRSLYEMWQLAGAGAVDGEAVRRGVLDYLSEGVPSTTAQRLAERTEFAYTDWVAEWPNAASEQDARQWRAAAARLLGSYPDHPGLLATRAVAAAFVADGSTVDALETELSLSICNAVDRYQVGPADIEQMLLWLLDRFTTANKPRHAAAVAVAAHTTLGSCEGLDRWLHDNYPLNPHLAGLLLTERLAEAQQITRQMTRQITDQDTTRKETS